ncbi:4-(cytidine 5'-diphospho)-2-C-methyl-D-erythritol kinase [Ahrensia kielensis]|uniref:4-diphosphocytidyl-2-C-methyl-D-erythritol kinase n=1 Tax=Ahrensia kielensis TaxID=76980 RepID=A0ABU9T7Q9_9HYPH
MQLLNAPAKINLALHVTGQREDGYHLIDSLVVFAGTVDACDTVHVSTSIVDGFGISGPFAHDLTDDVNGENLVINARDHVRLGAIKAGVSVPAVHISLEKRLPIASGLGGGSSDAAAALTLLHKHWKVPFDPDHSGPAALSKKLGADVPMCMLKKPVHVTGIGEKVSILKNFPKLNLVLVNCGQQISTPDVFSALKTKDNSAIFDLPDDAEEIVPFLKDRTRNDLEEAAIDLCPDIQKSLHLLYSQGAILARMSGSGATCFGIFDSAPAARTAAQAINDAEPKWWVKATRTTSSS